MRSPKQFITIVADIAALKEQIGRMGATLQEIPAAIKAGERGSWTKTSFACAISFRNLNSTN